MGGGGGTKCLPPPLYSWKKSKLKREGNIPKIKRKFVKFSGCLLTHWKIPPSPKNEFLILYSYRAFMCVCAHQYSLLKKTEIKPTFLLDEGNTFFYVVSVMTFHARIVLIFRGNSYDSLYNKGTLTNNTDFLSFSHCVPNFTRDWFNHSWHGGQYHLRYIHLKSIVLTEFQRVGTVIHCHK
jgi:hypothetical protein